MNLMALQFCTHRSLHFYSYRETTDSVLHLLVLKIILDIAWNVCFHQDQDKKSEK